MAVCLNHSPRTVSVVQVEGWKSAEAGKLRTRQVDCYFGARLSDFNVESIAEMTLGLVSFFRSACRSESAAAAPVGPNGASAFDGSFSRQFRASLTRLDQGLDGFVRRWGAGCDSTHCPGDARPVVAAHRVGHDLPEQLDEYGDRALPAAGPNCASAFTAAGPRSGRDVSSRAAIRAFGGSRRSWEAIALRFNKTCQMHVGILIPEHPNVSIGHLRKIDDRRRTSRISAILLRASRRSRCRRNAQASQDPNRFESHGWRMILEQLEQSGDCGFHGLSCASGLHGSRDLETQ